jgi:hypothetical protein
MADLNKVILIGKIEDVSTTPSSKDEYGRITITFTLTTSCFVNGFPSGGRKPIVIKHPIIFKTKSTGMVPYLTKNRTVFIEGYVTYGENGNLQIGAYNVQLVGSNAQSTRTFQSTTGDSPNNYEMEDEDLPY